MLMDPNYSGLQQPSVNLGGLLNMGGLSGAPGSMGGGQQQGAGGSAGGGMTGGLDLAQLLEMMNQGSEAESFVGGGAPLGSGITSLAQQQAMGQGGFQQQPYLTAGSMGQSGGGGSFAGGSADPFAIAQKFLSLLQKGAGAAGLNNQPLSGIAGGEEFDPTGQMQQQGVQEFRAGERGDTGGFDLNAFQRLLQGFPTPGNGLLGEVGSGGAPPSDIFNPNFMGGGPGGASLNESMIGELGDVDPATFSALTGEGGSNPFAAFNPTVGNSLGSLGGLLALYQGIQNDSPTGIAGGSIGSLSALANMLGYSDIGTALGGLSGPLSLYGGIQSGDPGQIAQGVGASISGLNTASGALGGPTLSSLGGSLGGAAGGALGALAGGYGVYSGIQNEDPVGTAAGALGAVGGGIGAATGSGAASAGTAIAGTTLGTLGGAATGLGAVLAVAMIVNALAQKGMPLDFNHYPTPSDISKQRADAGTDFLSRAVPYQDTLPELTNLLNTHFAPNGEVQFGSGPEFGWAGDQGAGGDAASPNWQTALQLLRNPTYLQQGEGADWVDPFVRGLWVKSGQTGAADYQQADLAYRLQSQLADALPDMPAYANLKTSYTEGGDLYAAEQARADAHDQWLRDLPNPDNWPLWHLPAQLSASTIRNYSMNPYIYDPQFGEPTGRVATPRAPGIRPPKATRPGQVPAQEQAQAMLPTTPHPAALGLMGGLSPAFNAQGEDDPMQMLQRWAQYGGYV